MLAKFNTSPYLTATKPLKRETREVQQHKFLSNIHDSVELKFVVNTDWTHSDTSIYSYDAVDMESGYKSELYSFIFYINKQATVEM